jgi:hypothetical protein
VRLLPRSPPWLQQPWLYRWPAAHYPRRPPWRSRRSGDVPLRRTAGRPRWRQPRRLVKPIVGFDARGHQQSFNGDAGGNAVQLRLKWEVLEGDAHDAIVRMQVSPQARAKCPELPESWEARYGPRSPPTI